VKDKSEEISGLRGNGQKVEKGEDRIPVISRKRISLGGSEGGQEDPSGKKVPGLPHPGGCFLAGSWKTGVSSGAKKETTTVTFILIVRKETRV